jgi:hypothetical protein
MGSPSKHKSELSDFIKGREFCEKLNVCLFLTVYSVSWPLMPTLVASLGDGFLSVGGEMDLKSVLQQQFKKIKLILNEKHEFLRHEFLKSVQYC